MLKLMRAEETAFLPPAALEKMFNTNKSRRNEDAEACSMLQVIGFRT